MRALAARVAELAARPVEKEKENLWRDHNALKPTRPLIFCDPENGWNEIIPAESLLCATDPARGWEMILRKDIFWAEAIRDDRVTRAVIDIPHVYAESDWGMRETRIGGADGGSYAWDAPLKDFAEIDRLRFPIITLDHDRTTRNANLAREIFDGILDVRLHTTWWWTLGLTQTYSNLRGLKQMLIDFIKHPREMHSLMTFLRDGTLARLNFLAQQRLLAPNNGGDYVGSGGFGWSDELNANECSPQTMWGFAEAQETIGVSPKMFAEMILPYQIAILDRFGLNCYGCCEPLDQRWEFIRAIPRLRRVSVSPWANIPKMAEALGAEYICSLKPSPNPLAVPVFNEDAIRCELREKLNRLKDCRVEIIMKDNHTLANDPRRVTRWVEIAREECERIGC